MTSLGAATCAAPLSSARAEASRRNGARSRGPKTPEGKASSARNALKHGFRAQRCVVLPSESAAEFAALEAALMEELAPDGALQAVLAQRVVAATWRLARAERLEVQLFAENDLTGRSIGLALIRDCNGARSFDTLLRYRGGALAELWRALRTLKALQAEAAAQVREVAAEPAARLTIGPKAARTGGIEIVPDHTGEHPHGTPIEPEGRANPCDLGLVSATHEPALPPPVRAPAPARPASRAAGDLQPNKPGPGPTQAGATVGREARRTAPGAIAPPRERRNLAPR